MSVLVQMAKCLNLASELDGLEKKPVSAVSEFNLCSVNGLRLQSLMKHRRRFVPESFVLWSSLNAEAGEAGEEQRLEDAKS